MISTHFTTKSLTERIHIQLTKTVRLLTPLANWTEGRIFRGLGSIAVQEENFTLPACIVLPNDEEEKTTAGQNSSILMSFAIVLFFEQHQQFLEIDETTIMSVVSALKGWLYARPRSALQEEGTGAALVQKIESFKTLSYDTIEFEDGTIVGICPVIVTYYTSAETVSRNVSIGTT